MRNQQIFYLLFIFCVGCVSDIQEWSTIKISGKIENKDIKSITFYPIETLADNPNNLQKVLVNEDGNFTVNYALKRPTSALVMMGNERYMFFLEPNKNIVFRYGNDQSFEFLSDNKKNNASFIQYQNEFSPYFNSKLNYRIDSTHFSQQLDSVSVQKLSFLESNKKKFSKEFIKYLENDIRYFAAKEKIYFARRYAINLIKEKNNYFDFLDSIKVQENSAVNSINYLNFLDNYINYLYLRKIWGRGADFQNDYIEKYYIANSELEGEPLEQVLTENFALGLQSSLINEEFMLLLNKFISGDYTENSKNLLKQKLSNFEENKLSEGKIVPDFSLKNRDNKYYSLSDFTKDYVILDFWASWCGPCRREIPEMKMMTEKYKEKVELVYISIDRDINEWEKAIENLQLPEPSLLIDNETRKNYDFDKRISVPFYLVIDKKGTILLSNPTKDEIVLLLKK